MRQRKRSAWEERQAADLAELVKTSGLPEETCYTLLNGEEEYVVPAIKQYLRTPEQKAWLDSHDLTIPDLLNGRYGGDVEAEVDAMYEAWNAKLGRKYFGA